MRETGKVKGAHPWVEKFWISCKISSDVTKSRFKECAALTKMSQESYATCWTFKDQMVSVCRYFNLNYKSLFIRNVKPEEEGREAQAPGKYSKVGSWHIIIEQKKNLLGGMNVPKGKTWTMPSEWWYRRITKRELLVVCLTSLTCVWVLEIMLCVGEMSEGQVYACCSDFKRPCMLQKDSPRESETRTSLQEMCETGY